VSVVDVSQVETEYLAQFVRGEGDQLAADQTTLISNLSKATGGGWTYQGFASMTEAVIVRESGQTFPAHDNDKPVGAASRTSGVMLYFARKPIDLVAMPDGGVERGAGVGVGFASRRQRRAAGRKK
jgi:hypothetical protein